MDSNLIKITRWGNRHHDEIRIEIMGNGQYVMPEYLTEFIKANAERLSGEILHNSRMEA